MSDNESVRPDVASGILCEYLNLPASDWPSYRSERADVDAKAREWLRANKELSPKDTDDLLATIRKHVEKIPCHDCRSVPCWYCELKRLVIDEKVEAPQ